MLVPSLRLSGNAIDETRTKVFLPSLPNVLGVLKTGHRRISALRQKFRHPSPTVTRSLLTILVGDFTVWIERVVCYVPLDQKRGGCAIYVRCVLSALHVLDGRLAEPPGDQHFR